MGRILKSEPLPHVVVCDTNMLWHEDKTLTVSPDFESFWNTQSQVFELALVIPEVVKGELLFQHFSSCHKLLKTTEDNLKKISAIAVEEHSIRITPEKLRVQIEKKFHKWISQHKATVLPIPTTKIDWLSIANAAVWRLPPFEPDSKNPESEKGFRDALIMETICNFVQEDTRKINIAFLCNDHALRVATATRLKSDSRFYAYETLKDFESYLNLTKEKLTNEFISKILVRARLRFFSDGDNTCLAIRDNIVDELKSQYAQYFDDVSKSEKTSLFGLGLGISSQNWNPISSGTFWVSSPEFLRVENERNYFWKSLVHYARLYSRTVTPSVWPTLISPPNPPPTPSIEEKVLMLPFHITWSSMVKSDARFHELKIVNTELIENEFRTPTEEELNKYKLKNRVPT